MLDENANVVIDGGYDDIIQIHGEIIVAKKGENYGAINKNGEEKIPFEYQECPWIHL